jgi:D-lyxose ketol-isomerase
VDLSPYSNYKQVKKVWGREIWLTNNDDYCAKYLELKPGYKCSLHCHPIKHETFFVLEGTVILITTVSDTWPRRIHILGPGDNFDITPNLYHSFQTLAGDRAIILEVSTKHDDLDVVRLEESGPTT